MAGEIIARVAESLEPGRLRRAPVRITLPPTPAPTARNLEAIYYPDAARVASAVQDLMVER